MNEDNCRIRRGNAAELLSGMRHIAINILKQDKGFKAGLKRKMRKAAKQKPHTLTLGWDDDEGIVMEFDATRQDEGQGESA